MTFRFNWGVGIALFYTAFALSTVGFVAYAVTRDVPLVSEDYYARALSHDAHMQAVANANALGAEAGARVDAGEVIVRVPAAMATLARGTVTLYRAANAGADRSVPLVPAADGTQTIATAGMASGQWRVQVQWSADGRDYYFERHVRLP